MRFIKMECQKIINLLGNLLDNETDNDAEANGTYNANKTSKV